ncbi:glycosyltransferase [Candidatus Raskinella chloraquaticus]|uniref:glycosyltransferase n=1 Tax=Candidatus Raskinella chloraquaticus TaxID=1951219 RepID=UPI00378644F4
MTISVAFILKGYPRLSESFIAQEIFGLERAGMAIRIFSMRRPTDSRIHPIHRAIMAPVVYLPEYLYQEPWRVVRALWRVSRRAGFSAALRAILADLPRDPSPNRFRRFGQAAVLVDELGADVVHLHAHFIHTPASVGRYASLMSGLAWSASAHAKDIWTSQPWELRQKLDSARFSVTCTKVGYETLCALSSRADAVHLVYHGLDLERFAAGRAAPQAPDGSDPARPVQLLSVGRAVDKKGYDLLLKALAGLPASVNWRFEHIGGGEGLSRLKGQAAALGLQDRIIWHGARDQIEVLAAYRRADLFILPSRIAEDGDRDGLPNVLMEAQSQGVACLSTAVSGIPELILDGETGVLVAPGDAPALTAALQMLIATPARRAALGAAGEKRVRHVFDHRRGLMTLLGLFRDCGVPLAAIDQ